MIMGLGFLIDILNDENTFNLSYSIQNNTFLTNNKKFDTKNSYYNLSLNLFYIFLCLLSYH